MTFNPRLKLFYKIWLFGFSLAMLLLLGIFFFNTSRVLTNFGDLMHTKHHLQNEVGDYPEWLEKSEQLKKNIPRNLARDQAVEELSKFIYTKLEKHPAITIIAGPKQIPLRQGQQYAQLSREHFAKETMTLTVSGEKPKFKLWLRDLNIPGSFTWVESIDLNHSMFEVKATIRVTRAFEEKRMAPLASQ